MDTSNKHRLRTLIVQLGSLLSQKKSLNSKVTSRYFEVFRDAIESGSDAFEIKSRLNRLEQALKQEGLFKNVKGDFGHLKKDIIGALYLSDNSQSSKPSLPGINSSGGVAKDRTFYIAPKGPGSENEQAAASGSTTQKHGVPMSTDDMRMLNTAIGKLYRHLQINAKESETTKTDFAYKDDATKENVNILNLSSHMQPEETFHDIVLKIRNFEKEFQRQKVQQHRDLMRMHDEIKRLNKNTNELRKENERIKGVQPIVTKAKGKQVERLEERHRSEKKGMEDKISELESGMRKNLEVILHDKEEARHQFRADVDSLVSSVNNIHYMVLGHNHDSAMSTIYGTSDNDGNVPFKKLFNILTSTASGVQILKSKHQDLTSKSEDLAAWRKCLKDTDREVSRFCRAYDVSDDMFEDRTHTTLHQDNDPQTVAFSCKTKLQKAKENINTKMRGISDSASIIKSKEREVQKHKRSIEELHAEICKLHDQVIAVQIQDISISMPAFDRRQDGGDRSDGSADELPEADRQEQKDILEKLKQTGTMVTHFQQLIIDRTSTLNKMENDMLPLKIRVNRLHEEISRAMTSSESPEHDPADDILKSRRGPSPEGPTAVVSREISNMLKKLSKMELTIRHLLEHHQATGGRASI